MNRFTKGSFAVLGSLAMGLGLAGPAAAQFGGPPPPPNTGVPVYAGLNGWSEVPGPGDGSGSGRVTLVVDPPKGQICYMFYDVITQDKPTVAHVHTGAAGQAGAPVVTLQAPVDGTASGCLPIAADLAQAIVANPAGYYVNVHSAAFPQGAIRGQLQG
ncbi:MAG TPA: CHRD domain-containing protein [Croceibacterium sp.]|nr:CHRD domain-containing protein [Croceibacterium sp.]